MRRRVGAAAALTCLACQSPAPAPPSGSAAPAVSAGAASAARPVASVAPRPSGSAELPVPLSVSIEQGTLAKISHDQGAWVGELERTPPARVWLTIATKKQPLAARARAAHARLAERVAPGVVAPTALRTLSVAEVSRAASGEVRKRLERDARVLANGTIEVALTLAPAPTLTRVDLAAVDPDSPVQAWERLLGARDAVPEAAASGLAQYQALLTVDHLAGNLARVGVYRQDKSGRITAADGNEAFSPTPTEGALSDALSRLSRHMTYSKSLDDRLSKLEREELERALGLGEPPTLLVTPKQLEECLDRARNVRRLIAERVKQRGASQALALP
ncbi:MAG: hypothetical protein HYZ29_13560 [Myxococcales bacterium]|nr:hypothetical protein [Myxococcales bacterium]